LRRKMANPCGICSRRPIDHYIHTVVPSQHMVRPEVMAAYRRSNERFCDLHRKLAK
jgi:hypothetical protein